MWTRLESERFDILSGIRAYFPAVAYCLISIVPVARSAGLTTWVGSL